jgi:hypothetical protein
VPPSTPRTTATTPAAKSGFEIRPARHRPNANATSGIARGNELKTTRAHDKSFRTPSVRFPGPAHTDNSENFAQNGQLSWPFSVQISLLQG